MSGVRVGILSAVLAIAAAWAGGCGAPGVKFGSRDLAHGKGVVSAVAPDSGTVYVVDATDRKNLYTGRVRGGDDISVNPGAGLVQINGLNAAEQSLKANHEYQILFHE